MVSSYGEFTSSMDIIEKKYLAEDEVNSDFYRARAAVSADLFKEKNLVIIRLEEGSGSVRHLLEGLLCQNGNILLTVKRIINGIGTCDMARWIAFIPVDKKYAGCKVSVQIK